MWLCFLCSYVEWLASTGCFFVRFGSILCIVASLSTLGVVVINLVDGAGGDDENPSL